MSTEDTRAVLGHAACKEKEPAHPHPGGAATHPTPHRGTVLEMEQFGGCQGGAFESINPETPESPVRGRQNLP